VHKKQRKIGYTSANQLYLVISSAFPKLNVGELHLRLEKEEKMPIQSHIKSFAFTFYTTIG